MNRGAAPPQGLTDLQTRTQALALTTDVALGTSAVALGTGLVVYLVQRARHRAAAPALIAAPRTTLARNARE